MNVIRHQHVGIHDAAIALPIMLEAFEVGDAVAFVAKDIAPVITPNDDMIQSAVKFDSRLAGHDLLLSLKTSINQ